jgi:uncharacterized SAM-binding protein YcdF (DUF218 family)
MFFVFSKLLWWLAAPSNAIGFSIAAGAVVGATRYRRIGVAMSAVGASALLLCGFGPVGVWLLRPLEDRFERPANLTAPAGIIVLGGDIRTVMFEHRGSLEPNGARLTEAVGLARRFPLARVVFTGGSANLLAKSIPEAEVAERFLVAMGVPSGRMTFESRSRNTAENATLTRDLLSPKPGERWLLVTSAFHMPRAMGAFRRAGFDVIAWPADYQTLGAQNEWLMLHEGMADGLKLVDIGVKEWIGLAAYRLTDRTDQFLPGPE